MTQTITSCRRRGWRAAGCRWRFPACDASASVSSQTANSAHEPIDEATNRFRYDLAEYIADHLAFLPVVSPDGTAPRFEKRRDRSWRFYAR